MSMGAKIFGRVRGLFAGNYPENREDEQVNLNTRGDMIVALGLPDLAEIVRMGDSWAVLAGAGQAALTVRPTTTSGLSIVNNEPATGKSIIIESFGSSEEVIDATQTDVTALYAMLNRRASVLPSAGTLEAATQFNSLNGKAGAPTNIAARRGATVVNDNWYAHATEGAQMAAVAAGANFKVNEAPRVRGLYIVPPTGAFSIAAVKAAAAAAAQQFYFIRFHLAQLPVTT